MVASTINRERAICGARHDARRISWGNGKNAGAFASDLGPGRPFDRVYPDAADEGFVLVSARTGAETVWVVVEQIYDATPDREVVGWRLAPTMATRREFPRLANVRITIWND